MKMRKLPSDVARSAGDFALHGDEVNLHRHAVVAKRNGTAPGGHLLKDHVHPALEVLIVDASDHLRRRALGDRNA